MAWDFLRKFLKLMGGKIVSKLAPRLLIFQYYDRLYMELEEQKKKFRVLYQKSEAELAFYQMLTHKRQFKIGMSSILEDSHENRQQVNILEVHTSEDFWDDKTVSSHYDDRDSEVDFIELQDYRNADKRASSRTYDDLQDTTANNNKIELPYKYQLSKNQSDNALKTNTLELFVKKNYLGVDKWDLYENY